MVRVLRHAGAARPAVSVPALDLRLNKPQYDAFNAFQPDNTIVLGWGRGVGKSWFLRQLCWMLVSQWEHKLRTSALIPFTGVRIDSLTPTLKQFKQVHWAGIEEELGPSGRWGFLGARFDRAQAQIFFPGGSSFRSFPATEANSQLARGMRTDLLFADELDDIPAGVYDAVAVPWLSEPWSLGYQVLGGTPTKGRHGLWWRSMQDGRTGDKLRRGETVPDLDDDAAEALSTVYSFHATYRDAPETVSPRAVKKAKATTPAATFKREWEADADAGEGLVYPFEEDFHIRAPPPIETFREFHVGADHGTADPGNLTLWGILGHGNDAEAWALDEHYESECPNHIWDERVAKWARTYGATFWPDPSRPDRINTWRNLGANCQKVNNEIQGGISRVADMLFRRKSEYGDDYARMYVSPKCRNLIKEFGLYVRKKLPDGTFSDDPKDKNNHAMDSTRYFVVGRFGLAGSSRKHVAGGR